MAADGTGNIHRDTALSLTSSTQLGMAHEPFYLMESFKFSFKHVI